jgi:hypothetical protein
MVIFMYFKFHFDPSTYGRIMLKHILHKEAASADSTVLSQCRGDWRDLEHCYEVSGSTECGEFLDKPRIC